MSCFLGQGRGPHSIFQLPCWTLVLNPLLLGTAEAPSWPRLTFSPAFLSPPCTWRKGHSCLCQVLSFPRIFELSCGQEANSREWDSGRLAGEGPLVSPLLS